MTIRRSTQHLLAATVAAALVLTACSGTDDPTEDSTAIDDVPVAADPTTDPPDDPTSVPAQVTTSIPQDFPLDAYLDVPPVDGTILGPDRDVRGARALTMCGKALAFPNADHLDPEHELGYSISTIEGYDGRTLHAYPTVRRAIDRMRELRSQIEGCDRDTGGVGAPAGQLYTVVRVANAVLAVEWSSEGSAEYFAASVPRQLELVGLIAADMKQAFAGHGSSTAGDTVTAIPDDIPLGVDLWDARGDGGEYHPEPYHPDAAELGATVDLCDRTVWPVSNGVDQLWAWATGPEYGDRRELVTLPTVDAAVAAVGAFREALTDCDGEETTVWTVSGVDTGYDSVVFSRSYTQGLGLDSFQVTRVGNAVLLTLISGEGAIGDIDATDRVRTELTQDLAPYLCVFTAAGC